MLWELELGLRDSKQLQYFSPELQSFVQTEGPSKQKVSWLVCMRNIYLFLFETSKEIQALDALVTTHKCK